MSELADRPLRVPEEPLVLHWWRLLRWFSNLRLVPQRREHAARILARLPRAVFYEGLTRPGKIILLCCLFIFLESYRVNSDFLLATAATGLALLWWAAILGSAFRPRVSVQRNTPAVAVAGQPLVSQIQVRNTGPRALQNFTVRELRIHRTRWPLEWSRPHVGVLAPGHECQVSIHTVPQRRGLLTLPGLAVQSYFPFFLTRFTQRLLVAAEVAVLPATLPVAIPSLRKIAEQASKRLTQGMDASRKGPSLDYAYSRPFQTGDSLRRLDHRAGSRRGQPMSKVFEGAEEIRRDKVYLMLDLTLEDFARWQPHPPDPAPLEARLALAVEIGLSAQNEGFTLTALATGRHWQPLANLLEFYRCIAACEPQRAVTQRTEAMPRQVLAEDGLHIMIVGRWTDHHRSLLEQWQRAGILVLVFMLPETAADVGSLPVGRQFVEVDLPPADSKKRRRP
ncbi:MAG: hypothetical protein RLZZ385_1131 [Pseudomonadota bacterium]|jgi:uncharacterized protein (DUF58 family)